MEEEFLGYLDTIDGSQQKKSLAWALFMHKKLNQKGGVHKELDFNVLINGVKAKGFDARIEEGILKVFESFKNGKTSISIIHECIGLDTLDRYSKKFKKKFLTQSQFQKTLQALKEKQIQEKPNQTVLTSKRKTIGQQRREVILENENRRKNKTGDSDRIITQKKKNKQLYKFYRTKIQEASIEELSAIENEIKSKVKSEPHIKNLQDFINERRVKLQPKKRPTKKSKSSKETYLERFLNSEKEEPSGINFNPPIEKIYPKIFNPPIGSDETEEDPLHRK